MHLGTKAFNCTHAFGQRCIQVCVRTNSHVRQYVYNMCMVIYIYVYIYIVCKTEGEREEYAYMYTYNQTCTSGSTNNDQGILSYGSCKYLSGIRTLTKPRCTCFFVYIECLRMYIYSHVDRRRHVLTCICM